MKPEEVGPGELLMDCCGCSGGLFCLFIWSQSRNISPFVSAKAIKLESFFAASSFVRLFCSSFSFTEISCFERGDSSVIRIPVTEFGRPIPILC